MVFTTLCDDCAAIEPVPMVLRLSEHALNAWVGPQSSSGWDWLGAIVTWNLRNDVVHRACPSPRTQFCFNDPRHRSVAERLRRKLISLDAARGVFVGHLPSSLARLAPLATHDSPRTLRNHEASNVGGYGLVGCQSGFGRGSRASTSIRQESRSLRSARTRSGF